jgi:hypothetical protein
MSIRALPDKYATPVLLWGSRLRSYPIPTDQGHVAVEGLYLQRKAEYVPTPLDTPDAEYPGLVCVECQPVKEEGDGVWFKTVFANLPNIFVDYPSMSVTYPGFADGRAPMPPRTVTAKLVRRFYPVGGSAYPTPDYIPVEEQTSLYYSGTEIGFLLGGNTITIDSFTVSTGGSDPGVTANPLSVGGFLFNSPMTINGAGALTRYQSMMLADLVPDNYSIVAEASKPQRYMGNFWFTDTVYVKAR